MPGLVIAIGGLSAVGKSTLCALLSKHFDLPLLSLGQRFREKVRESGMDIYEIIYYPQLCAEIDAAITSAVVNEIRMAGRCILEGHAAGLLCYEGPAFRVLLHAPWCVRVDRMTRRDGFSAAETVRKLNSLDTYTIQRFKDMFGAEINDTSSYEISIDTSADEPNQLVGIVIDAVDRWERAHGSAIAH